MKKNIDVKQEMLSEEFDTDTFEYKAETEELSNASDDESDAAMLVKQAYATLGCGHAVLRRKILPLYTVVLAVFFFGGLFVFAYAWPHGWIGSVFVALAVAFAVFFGKSGYRIFDVYYFMQNGKRYIFYVNKNYCILYKNRNLRVCIKNKTKQTDYPYYDSYMNLKMGFQRMIGDMSVKKTSKGYKIRTTQFGRDRFSDIHGESQLTVNGDCTPEKITVGRNYEYVFDGKKTFTFSVPEELVAAAKAKGIDFDFNDERIIVAKNAK